jgi:L-lactate utilization protein LutB
MEHQTKTRPYALDLDIDQWRRDISTFASTTGQALEAIISELSASCTEEGGSRHVYSVSDEQPLCNTPIDRLADPGGDDRLAKLKSQIAERLAKSN